jgi:3-deoxy-D-manno-octulosonate 8-phosphate phosphatase (KDO 8-P phosphatase)
VDDAEVAYMGDDIVDLAVLGRVGLSASPADAVEDVRTRVHWISGAPGGRGAVRELIEVVLRAQGRWDTLVASYMNDRPHVAGTHTHTP